MESKKRLILTGGSGFLGKHLIDSLGAEFDILTLGRRPIRGIENILYDLSKKEVKRLPKVDMVIHAAGKAHLVPVTDEEKKEFFDVNVEGTRRLLAGLEGESLPESLVYISSIAVYGKESGDNITESEPLTAVDPYGLSKMEAERLVLEWGTRNNVTIGVLRLPLLVGKEAPGNFGAMVNAINKGHYMNIAKGDARKSMLLARDVAGVIPELCKKGGVYNLTDGNHPSFRELSDAIARGMGKSGVPSIPYKVAKIMAKIGDVLAYTFGFKAPLNSNSFTKMTNSLTFCDEKARKDLNWSPQKVINAIPDLI